MGNMKCTNVPRSHIKAWKKKKKKKKKPPSTVADNILLRASITMTNSNEDKGFPISTHKSY
jgi:hypothetical protein